EPVKEVKPKSDDKSKPADKKAPKKKVNSEDNGFTLVLKKFPEGKTTSFGFVKDYAFAKYGQGLLFTPTGNDSTLKAGVCWVDLKSEKLQMLYEGKSKFKFKGLSIS